MRAIYYLVKRLCVDLGISHHAAIPDEHLGHEGNIRSSEYSSPVSTYGWIWLDKYSRPSKPPGM